MSEPVTIIVCPYCIITSVYAYSVVFQRSHHLGLPVFKSITLFAEIAFISLIPPSFVCGVWSIRSLMCVVIRPVYSVYA